MAASVHSALTTTDGIHIPYAFSYATAAARLAATGFVAADVGKLARQTSDNTLWLLTSTTSWIRVSVSTDMTDVGEFSVDSLVATASSGGSGELRAGRFKLTTGGGEAASAEIHTYQSGSKFVIAYLDGATARYKYLDMAGTGVTWVHTTSAP